MSKKVVRIDTKFIDSLLAEQGLFPEINMSVSQKIDFLLLRLENTIKDRDAEIARLRDLHDDYES